MSHDEEHVYRRAHYYLLAKGHYVHTDSWWDECKSLVAFYLDKANPTDQEIMKELLEETHKAFEVLALMGDLAIVNENGEHPKRTYEESFIDFNLTLMNYLVNIEFNNSIVAHGYKEALAQTCMTIMMRLMLPDGVELGGTNARLLPVVQNEARF